MLPPRLRPRTGADDPGHDTDLTWDELIATFEAVASGVLSEEDEAWGLAYLEANLPGAQVEDLLRWPGVWFGSRWLEEVELAPEDAAFYAADRAGRTFPGQPDDWEPPV